LQIVSRQQTESFQQRSFGPTRIIRTPEGEMRSSYMMMLSNDMHLLLNRSY
jgi:hypothetical protein